MLDEAVEEKAGGEKVRIGMVVRVSPRLLAGVLVVRDGVADWSR